MCVSQSMFIVRHVQRHRTSGVHTDAVTMSSGTPGPPIITATVLSRARDEVFHSSRGAAVVRAASLARDSELGTGPAPPRAVYAWVYRDDRFERRSS